MNLNTKKFSVLRRTVTVFLFTLGAILITGAFFPTLPGLLRRVGNLSGFYVSEKKAISDVNISYSSGRTSLLAPKNLNRAETIKLVVAALNVEPNPVNFLNCFKDVRDEWFAVYICYAKSKKWISGYPDGLFHPSEDVRKTDAIRILFAAFGIVSVNQSSRSASMEISTMTESPLATNVSDNDFLQSLNGTEVDAKLTRAQFMELIDKTLSTSGRFQSRP